MDQHKNYTKTFKKCTCPCDCGARNVAKKNTKPFAEWSLEEKQEWAKSKGFEWKDRANSVPKKENTFNKTNAFEECIFKLAKDDYKEYVSDDE